MCCFTVLGTEYTEYIVYFQWYCLSKTQYQYIYIYVGVYMLIAGINAGIYYYVDNQINAKDI